MVSVVVFEFGGMRCQPLRRALAFSNVYKLRYL
ncbi:acetyltransferase [Vibrio cholerae]|nr:acetyltransferase [Vibrio cholerae]